jgi:hypothetical protein
MKSTSPKFWKNYERVQTNMAKACMPRSVGLALAAHTSSAQPTSIRVTTTGR